MLVSRRHWSFGDESIIVHKKFLSLLLEINGMQYTKSRHGEGMLFLLLGGFMNEVKRRA